jgi:poly(3-hydroxybutyrate) depolymerase
MRAIVALCLLSTSVFANAADHQTRRETFTSNDATRVEYVFVPENLSPNVPAPVLLLLHGSNGDGAHIARWWLDLASREGFIVIAPDSSDKAAWRLRQDSPQVLYDGIETVARQHPIDRKRIYLFGNSGGAVYALLLSMLESEYFAATAVHAGSFREKKQFEAIQFARRKIAVAIFIGDRDEYFSQRSVKDTIAALDAAGHPTLLSIIPRHTHNYRDVAADVNEQAWEFLKSRSLDRDPKLQLYQ